MTPQQPELFKVLIPTKYIALSDKKKRELAPLQYAKVYLFINKKGENVMGIFYFTSESVTEGHPDKLCDYISDSILDECLKQDKNSRVAVETFVSNNNVTIAGQITTKANINVEQIARDVIKEVGFDNSSTDMDYRTCNINIDISKQSPDIAMGVDIGGAGDQGIMFGYACDLYINNNFLNNGGGLGFPSTYKDILGKGKSIFTGKDNNNDIEFKIKEIEIFKVYK